MKFKARHHKTMTLYTSLCSDGHRAILFYNGHPLKVKCVSRELLLYGFMKGVGWGCWTVLQTKQLELLKNVGYRQIDLNRLNFFKRLNQIIKELSRCNMLICGFRGTRSVSLHFEECIRHRFVIR